jgi:hypothetical protein
MKALGSEDRINKDVYKQLKYSVRVPERKASVFEVPVDKSRRTEDGRTPKMPIGTGKLDPSRLFLMSARALRFYDISF